MFYMDRGLFSTVLPRAYKVHQWVPVHVLLYAVLLSLIGLRRFGALKISWPQQVDWLDHAACSGPPGSHSCI